MVFEITSVWHSLFIDLCTCLDLVINFYQLIISGGSDFYQLIISKAFSSHLSVICFI